ncbi:MAG: hypothetical protein ACJAY5_000967 [Actinomycetes bacterium]
MSNAYVDGGVVTGSFDAGLISGHWLNSRGARGLTCSEIKTRPVKPAFNKTTFDLTFGQRNLSVGTDVVNREDLPLAVYERDIESVNIHSQCCPIGNITKLHHFVFAP